MAVSDTNSTSIRSSLSYFLPCEEFPGSRMNLVNKYVKYDLKTETEVVSILFHPIALQNPATLILTERRRSFLSHTIVSSPLLTMVILDRLHLLILWDTSRFSSQPLRLAGTRQTLPIVHRLLPSLRCLL